MAATASGWRTLPCSDSVILSLIIKYSQQTSNCRARFHESRNLCAEHFSLSATHTVDDNTDLVT